VKKGQDAFYGPVRQRLAAGMSLLLDMPDIHPTWIDCPAAGYPARSALPLKLQKDPAALAELFTEERQAFGTLFGAPLLERVEYNNGHLLFAFTPAFYTAAMEEAIARYPLPEGAYPQQPEQGALAFYRMQSFIRKGPAHCPDYPPVQQALWLALGIPERITNKRLLKLRILETADALLTMGQGLPPRERPLLYAHCGSVGNAAARLMLLGITALGAAHTAIEEDKGGTII